MASWRVGRSTQDAAARYLPRKHVTPLALYLLPVALGAAFLAMLTMGGAARRLAGATHERPYARDLQGACSSAICRPRVIQASADLATVIDGAHRHRDPVVVVRPVR